MAGEKRSVVSVVSACEIPLQCILKVRPLSKRMDKRSYVDALSGREVSKFSAVSTFCYVCGLPQLPHCLKPLPGQLTPIRKTQAKLA